MYHRHRIPFEIEPGRDDFDVGLCNEIEKLRHDLIASRTKNGIYFSEERWGELIQESESKSRTMLEAKRRIELIELESIGVKKEFEKCLRILNVRESEMKKIQDEVIKKTKELDRSNELNRDLESRLSREVRLREKLEISRAKWKNQCKEAYEDNEGLRAKIARKAEVESFNQNTLNDVNQSLTTSVTKLKNDLKDFTHESNQINKGIRNFLSDMEQRLVQSMRNNQSLVEQHVQIDLEHIAKTINDSVTEFKSKVHQGFFDHVRSDLLPNELLNQTRSHLNSLVQTFEIEKFSAVQSTLDQLKVDTFSFLESTKDSVQSSFETIERKFTTDRAKLIKFHELEKTELKEEAARLKEDIELLRQHTLEDEKRAQQDEKELMELIQRQHVSNLKRKMAQTDSLVKSLGELKDRKDRKRLRFGGFEKEFDDSRNQFDSELDGTLGSANEKLATFESTFQERQANLVDRLMIDQRERINLHTIHSNRMEGVAHALDRKCEEFLQGFEKFDHELKHEVLKITDQVIGVDHRKLISQTQNQVQTVEEGVRHVLDDIERQSSVSNRCIDKTTDSITHLRDDIHVYLTNEIRKDIKTGQTPRRKKLLIKSNPSELERVTIRRARSVDGDDNSDDPEEAEAEDDEDEDLERPVSDPLGTRPERCSSSMGMGACMNQIEPTRRQTGLTIIDPQGRDLATEEVEEEEEEEEKAENHEGEGEGSKQDEGQAHAERENEGGGDVNRIDEEVELERMTQDSSGVRSTSPKEDRKRKIDHDQRSYIDERRTKSRSRRILREKPNHQSSLLR